MTAPHRENAFDNTHSERCELCDDLERVRYDVRSAQRPSPFCSACGRRLPVVVVREPAPDPAPRWLSIAGGR